MRSKISIIIPCYNQGHFLKDALESVEKCDKDDYELIIINDGSTEAETNKYLRELYDKGYHVIFQQNKGLSGARNAGINASKNEYILPLDSDNKIRPEYLTRAIRTMESNKEVAVVYGDANYFGKQNGIWKVGEFNLQRMMLYNYIDACAVIRRSVLDQVGFYDEGMEKQSLTDWDLWLRIGFAGYQFHYIENILFDYRVVENSMSATFAKSYTNPNQIENYIHAKYPDRMGQKWIVDLYARRFRKSPVLFIIKLVIRAWFPKYYNRLLEKNKIRNGI